MGTNDEYIKSLENQLTAIKADNVAIRDEFISSIPDEWSPDDLKLKFKELLADAFACIKQTINGDRENPTAFQAAKFAMTVGMGQIQIKDDNDPNKELNELLKALAQPNAPSTLDVASNIVSLRDGTENAEETNPNPSN